MILAMSAGRCGMSLVTWAMKLGLSIDSAGFQRFSKPRVEEGLPDSPAPQALPA